jgi:hypothetical protein
VGQILDIYAIDYYSTARIMRYLVTHHIDEVAPDTFANNFLSAVLDTGKSVSELFSTSALSRVLMCWLF